MAVGNIVQRVPRKGTRYYSGEYVVAAGAISAASVKTKGEVAVTFVSTGIVKFQCLENGVAARPAGPCRLTFFIPNVTLPGATAGGWSHFLNVDNLNTNGSFQYQFNQQSFAAADTTGTVKFTFAIEAEAA